MEDTLRGGVCKTTYGAIAVLILVLMEDTLRAFLDVHNTD